MQTVIANCLRISRIYEMVIRLRHYKTSFRLGLLPLLLLNTLIRIAISVRHRLITRYADMSLPFTCRLPREQTKVARFLQPKEK